MRSSRFVRWVVLGWAVACWTAVAPAAVKLPAVIGDNMVLQRGQPVPVWGWADKGEEVTVTWPGKPSPPRPATTAAGRSCLHKLDVGEPLEMTVKGSSGNTITLKNILVGEVWVCSGQSNMEMGVERCNNAKRRSPPPTTRRSACSRSPRRRPREPADRCEGQWTPCTPEHAVTRRILGGGLFLRPPVAQGIERAGRPDPHLVGRHARRVLDQPQGAGGRPRLEAAGPGRIVVPVQRHDRPADSLRHPRRDLVSGRERTSAGPINTARCFPR